MGLVRVHFNKVWQKGCIYRTTGVRLYNLVDSGLIQKDFFGVTDQENRLLQIHKKIDDLENKLGKRMVYLGSSHEAIHRARQGTDSDDLDRNLLFL